MAGPIPFPTPNHIPIVGQPFALKGWFSTVQIVCQCDAKEPLLLIGPAPVACPACGRGFQMAEIAFNLKTGQNHVGIAVGSAQQEKHPS